MNKQQQQFERLKSESLDELYARRDLLNLGLTKLREERKELILRFGQPGKVPKAQLAELTAREERVQFQIQQVEAALHLVMPPGEQRSIRKPRSESNG